MKKTAPKPPAKQQAKDRETICSGLVLSSTPTLARGPQLYPEIADAEAGEDPLPSCSAAEALERQEPFINQVLATSALAMLARLFHYGKLCHHGGFFNAITGKTAALPADPDVWRRIRKSKKRMARPG